MIVLIGGMFRSGSTFSFNIARELLLNRGGAETSLEMIGQASLSTSSARNLIIKSHAPDALTTALIRLGAIKCICTYRKPEYAITSWMNTFNFTLEESIASFKEWVNWHQSLSHHTLNIDYEVIERHPSLAIFKIQKYLLNKVNPIETFGLSRKYNKDKLRAIYQNLPEDTKTENIGFSYFDKETLFHRRHISSNTPKLNDETRAKIRSAFKKVIDEHGNYLPSPKSCTTNHLASFLN